MLIIAFAAGWIGFLFVMVSRWNLRHQGGVWEGDRSEVSGREGQREGDQRKRERYNEVDEN